MTDHIEEARKLAKDYAVGWLEEVAVKAFAAALTAAEDRGRMAERERVVSVVRTRVAFYAAREQSSDAFQEPSNSNWDMYRYTREAHERLLEEITKEPT